jgi:hypothetical protein
MEIRSLAAGRLNSILRQQLIIVASWRCDNLLPTQRIYYMCSLLLQKSRERRRETLLQLRSLVQIKMGRSFDVELQISKMSALSRVKCNKELLIAAILLWKSVYSDWLINSFSIFFRREIISFYKKLF